MNDCITIKDGSKQLISKMDAGFRMVYRFTNGADSAALQHIFSGCIQVDIDDRFE